MGARSSRPQFFTCESELELFGRCFGVIKEHLKEIADAVHEDAILVLVLASM